MLNKDDLLEKILKRVIKGKKYSEEGNGITHSFIQTDVTLFYTTF